MGLENKTNLIIAINGYKITKKEKSAYSTDISVIDCLNKKVLLRVMDSLDSEYVVANDVKDMEELIKRDSYDFGFLISKKFTDGAINEMVKQNILHVSDIYMPPFEIGKLYSAIIDCANSQCQKKCGKTSPDAPDCSEKNKKGFCKTMTAASDAKNHFEQGLVGLLKNDLILALALNKP